MKVHMAIKVAMLSVVLAGAVLGWGMNGLGSVQASSGWNSSSSLSVSESESSIESPSASEGSSPSVSLSEGDNIRVIGNEQGVIPSDAIRLRILANSDLEEDQAVKREVRDRVVEMMNGWLEEEESPSSREEARAMIQKHMEQLTTAANEVLQQRGRSYEAKAELQVVAFPAKLYGGEVYPAGDYEALRITLGAGEGQNWWCVLFPPLCFVDSSQGSAVAKEDGDESTLSSADASEVTEKAASGTDHSADTAEGSEREIRFFLWDVIVAIGEFIRRLFTAIFG